MKWNESWKPLKNIRMFIVSCHEPACFTLEVSLHFPLKSAFFIALRLGNSAQEYIYIYLYQNIWPWCVLKCVGWGPFKSLCFLVKLSHCSVVLLLEGESQLFILTYPWRSGSNCVKWLQLNCFFNVATCPKSSTSPSSLVQILLNLAKYCHTTYIWLRFVLNQKLFPKWWWNMEMNPMVESIKNHQKNKQKTMLRTTCLLHQPVFVFIVLLKHQADKPWKLPTEGWEMRQHSLNVESVPK